MKAVIKTRIEQSTKDKFDLIAKSLGHTESSLMRHLIEKFIKESGENDNRS
jgi:antitoxin component of RelBE/YafQ-DinJ toxin-antitoxin module